MSSSSSNSALVESSSSNDLALQSELYSPSINDNGEYIDKLPPKSHFLLGMRCPCGARSGHVYSAASNFQTHMQSVAHKRWLTALNQNRHNHLRDKVELEALVKEQRCIIARLETQVQQQNTRISNLYRTISDLSSTVATTIGGGASPPPQQETNVNLLDLDL